MAKTKVEKPRVIVFADGKPQYGEGGSGFEVLVRNSRTEPCVLDAEIVAGVSRYENGGIRQKCKDMGVPFEFRPRDFTSEWYKAIVEKHKADFVMLSGWLSYFKGVDPARVLNIHNGLLPMTKGLHGDATHQRALDLFRAGEIANTGLTIHFVTWKEHDPEKREYDAGPVACQHSVYMKPDDTLESVRARVNAAEHVLQSKVLDLVVHGRVFFHEGKTQVQDYQLKRILGIAGK